MTSFMRNRAGSLKSSFRQWHIDCNSSTDDTRDYNITGTAYLLYMDSDFKNGPVL